MPLMLRCLTMHLVGRLVRKEPLRVLLSGLMHIRAGAKGSAGFVIFKENLFLETLDLQTSESRTKIRCYATRLIIMSKRHDALWRMAL